jgi:hypothetical protein
LQPYEVAGKTITPFTIVERPNRYLPEQSPAHCISAQAPYIDPAASNGGYGDKRLA